MPLYEVLLDDWDEIRFSNEPLNVGELVEIENVDWFVVGARGAEYPREVAGFRSRWPADG